MRLKKGFFGLFLCCLSKFGTMKFGKKTWLLLVLLLGCTLVHVYSRSENRVEHGYSSRFSPAFSRLLRHISGNIPFSIGDILYGLLVGWLLWKIGRFIRGFFLAEPSVTAKERLSDGLLNVLLFCSAMYLIFNLMWGINYDRKGIAWQLGLDMKKYERADLEEINGLLVKKINTAKETLLRQNQDYPRNRDLFLATSKAYENVARQYKFLSYEPGSIKTSLWGWLGNYTGFTGYYNPFTGEANVNTNVPKFLQPFIACHEAAHQLGYAKEMEANFVGYLAASGSTDPLFHYSVYLDLFTYANRNLFYQDSSLAIAHRMQLDTAVLRDIQEWAAFNRKYQNAAAPVIRWIYGKYLQGNKQPQGILSYDEVTAFLIAYYKKFGRI